MFTSINKTVSSLFIVLVMTLFAINNAQAQYNQVNLEGRAGVVIPTGDFDRFNADAGFSTGLKASYSFSPYFELRADGDLGIFSTLRDVPTTRFWNVTAGPGVNFTNPNNTRWTVGVNGGLGFTVIETDDYQDSSFNETYFALSFGAKVGYDIASRVNLSLSSIGYITFADEDDTQFFANIPGGSSFEEVFTFPVNLGLSVRI